MRATGSIGSDMHRKPRQSRAREKETRERDLQHDSDFHAALLAMAGHDLRQPLQVIVSTHAWLSNRLTEPVERARLDRGAQAVMGLIKQLDHLVHALRIHERAGGLDLVPTALESLLQGINREYTDEARSKGVRLRVVQSRIVVISDGMLLHGILGNLVHNALKHTDRGGKILVGCRRRGQTLRIEVHDTGTGISSENLTRIFDAFQQVGSVQSDGLGLGLFIVRRAANTLGHRLEVRSASGVGSCFSIIADKAALSLDYSNTQPPRNTC